MPSPKPIKIPACGNKAIPKQLGMHGRRSHDRWTIVCKGGIQSPLGWQNGSRRYADFSNDMERTNLGECCLN